jgi:hypothetical protein
MIKKFEEFINESRINFSNQIKNNREMKMIFDEMYQYLRAEFSRKELELDGYDDHIEFNIGTTSVIFADNDLMNIESNEKYGIYMPKESEPSNLGKHFAIDYMDSDNFDGYEYLQVKSQDGEETNIELLKDVLSTILISI